MTDVTIIHRESREQFSEDYRAFRAMSEFTAALDKLSTIDPATLARHGYLEPIMRSSALVDRIRVETYRARMNP